MKSTVHFVNSTPRGGLERYTWIFTGYPVMEGVCPWAWSWGLEGGFIACISVECMRGRA